MNLTDQDHLKWCLQSSTVDTTSFSVKSKTELFSSRKDDYQKFEFTLGSIVRWPSPWWKELEKALSRLIDTHGRKIALFYSGGSDSEVILRTFVKLGVIPEVHTIKFSQELNSHETEHADSLCKDLGITPIIWHHDIDAYLKKESYLDLGIKYQCSQIAYLTVLEYARRVSLPVVMGGEIYLQRHQHQDGKVLSQDDWYYIYREDEDGVTYRYSMDTGHPIINEIMTYTPELLYSWLVHPNIRQVTSNKLWGKITILSIKKLIYEQELGIKLKAQSKFHGYEKLPWTNIWCRNQIRQHLPNQQVARLEYAQLLDNLRGQPWISTSILPPMSHYSSSHQA